MSVLTRYTRSSRGLINILITLLVFLVLPAIVTDAGLGIERSPERRRYRPWSVFDRYDLTDDTLVVYSSSGWKPSLRCARADIEDSEAAVTALEATLSTHG